MRSMIVPPTFLLICALLGLAGAADPVTTGGFAPEGAYVGCTWPAPGRPAGLATWGSHSGNDDLTGEFISVPFVLQGPFDLYIAGYPGRQNNRLELLVEGEDTAVPVVVRFQPAERWERLTIRPPSHLRGRTVRLHAVDETTGSGGWLALSSPLPAKTSGSNGIIWWSFGYLVLAVVLLTWPGMAWLIYDYARGKSLDFPMVAVQTFVPGLALCGLAYWAFLVHPWLGRTIAVAMVATPLVIVNRYGRAAWRMPGPLTSVGGLVMAWVLLTVGVLFVGFSVGSWEQPYETAATRYSHSLPGDNTIPGDFANGLLKGRVPRPLHGDWLSSDRPPLQASADALVAAIARPIMGTPRDTGHQVVGVLLQCLWLPAIATLCRVAGAPAFALGLVSLVLACSPIVIVHGFYVWPKLLSAALMLFALVPLCGVRALRELDKFAWANASASLTLAMLAHGGTAFMLPAVAVLVIVRLGRRAWPWRKLVMAACVAVVLLGAWKVYKECVDPPGNRLEKWHLAGITDATDNRELLHALRDAYASLTLEEWWRRRVTNIQVILGPAETPRVWWSALLGATGLRPVDGAALQTIYAIWFFNLLPAIGFSAFGVLAFADLRRRTRSQPLFRCATCWLGINVATLVVWIALTFEPASCVIHQGTLALPLLVMAMGLLGAWIVHPMLAVIIAIPSVASGWLLYGWSLAPALMEDTVIRPHDHPWLWGIGWLCVAVAVVGTALCCRGAPETRHDNVA